MRLTSYKEVGKLFEDLLRKNHANCYISESKTFGGTKTRYINCENLKSYNSRVIRIEYNIDDGSVRSFDILSGGDTLTKEAIAIGNLLSHNK
jgi:hypothetical protein